MVRKTRNTQKNKIEKVNTSKHLAMEYYSFLRNQSGSGYTRLSSKTQKRTNVLIQRFIQCGWDPIFIHQNLYGISDSMLRDYSEEDMILSAVKQWYIESDKPLYDTFIDLGLTPVSAQRLTDVVSELENTSYTKSQLIEKAIQYSLGAFQSVYESTTTYPYNPNLILKLYTLKPSVKAINLPYLCYEKCSQVVNEIVQKHYTPVSSNYSLYYHTTSWSYAELIMEELSHTAGAKCMDFGSTPGFYIGPSLQDAMQWGEKNRIVWSYQVAILVFSIPDKYPEHIQYKELKGEEWSSVMSFSRKCKFPTITAPEIRGYDIIKGYMLANTQETKLGKPPLTHPLPEYQVASKTTAGDQFLQSCIRVCIFFKCNTQV